MEYFSVYKSPIGLIRLISDGENLIKADFETCESTVDLPIFKKAEKWLDKYFSGGNECSNIPLNPIGTAFQKRVWKILLKIPYGETTTYGEIAKKFSSKMSAQAVGNAIGKNPLIIFIPCHRVIGTDGSLTGFSAGIEKKKFLLELENHQS